MTILLYAVVGLVIAGGLYFTYVGLRTFYQVGKARIQRLQELADSLEARKLYLQAMRHDLRTIAEAWAGEEIGNAGLALFTAPDLPPAVERYKRAAQAFEATLEERLACYGLELDGSPKPGLVPAEDLTGWEYAKLRDILAKQPGGILL